MPFSTSRSAAPAVIGGFCCLMLLSAAFAAQVDPDLYVLEMKFKAGDVTKYQTQMKWTVLMPGQAAGTGRPEPAVSQGERFDLNATQEIKVRRLPQRGVGELEVVTTGQNPLPGQPPLLPADAKPIYMTYDSQGKLLGIRRKADSPAESPVFSTLLDRGLLNMEGVVLPEKAVRIGETWTQKVATAGGDAGSLKGTFVRVETIGRYKTALLHLVITTPWSAALDAALQPTTRTGSAAAIGTGTSTVTSDVNLALNEGKVVRLVSNGSATMTISDPPVRPTKKAKQGKTPPAPKSDPALQGPGLKMTVHRILTTRLLEEPKK